MKFITLLSVVATVVATASARNSVNLKPEYDPDSLDSGNFAHLRKPMYDPGSLDSNNIYVCPRKCRVKKKDGVVDEKKCLVRLAGCVNDPKITVSSLIDIFAGANNFEATSTLIHSGSLNDFMLEIVLLPEGITINGRPATTDKEVQEYLDNALA
ncbi:hypothetical protein L914_06651 [Phytophthora nicotianae]|uniref:RxLR effector protein n=1 Tax=Phytophthora nicotianae TaxID=4792 RepID=W2NLR8_PHYNI|nr:hypothetical protein L914_06651 [Phytophthora nicotianae]